MAIFVSSAQSVCLNQYSALCASINFFGFWTMPNHMLKKHQKSQVTNVVPTGTRSPARTKQVVRGHRCNQKA